MTLREKAEKIFAWGFAQRTDDLAGGWKNHSFGAAKVAETVAKKAGLDAEKAYAMGLLHDIGRYNKEARLDHIYLGYEKLTEENLPELARICLTHSFPVKEDAERLQLKDKAQTEFIKKFIAEIEYDDYDRLIQLADYMSGVHGITMIERRFCSVLYRHGLVDPRAEIIKLYDLKRYFDEKCGVDIYTLFREELSDAAFRGIPGSFGKVENDNCIKFKEGK